MNDNVFYKQYFQFYDYQILYFDHWVIIMNTTVLTTVYEEKVVLYTITYGLKFKL